MKSGGRPYVPPNNADPLPDAWFILTVFPLSHSALPMNYLSLSLSLSQLIEDACNYSCSVMSEKRPVCSCQ
jgi:hypothetical protein